MILSCVLQWDNSASRCWNDINRFMNGLCKQAAKKEKLYSCSVTVYKLNDFDRPPGQQMFLKESSNINSLLLLLFPSVFKMVHKISPWQIIITLKMSFYVLYTVHWYVKLRIVLTVVYDLRWFQPCLEILDPVVHTSRFFFFLLLSGSSWMWTCQRHGCHRHHFTILPDF